MSVWMESIKTGLEMYTVLAIPMAVIHSFVAFVMEGRVKFGKILFTQAFIAYMSCLFALVFLPLPDPSKAMEFTYKAQLIPFYFIADIIQNPVPAAVLVVIFNIVMTVPFGVFMHYYTKCSLKKVVVYGFLLSLFIELIQFTGIFFLLPGSYRLFDVDDLICNALGAGLGYMLVNSMEQSLCNVKLFVCNKKRLQME